jgi:hypothetical protein
MGETPLVKAQATATWFGEGKVPPVSFPIDTGASVTILLQPGRWVLAADAPNDWGAPFQLEIPDRANDTPAAAPVTLELWPAGRIEGGISLSPGIKPPGSLTVYFRSTGNSTSPSHTAQANCPLRKEVWTCKLPAGTLDVRFQAAGFIPRYLWGVQVPPRGTVHPGRIELRQGSAVQGWVVSADGAVLGDAARISLRPRISGAIQDAGERKRLETLRFEAAVNAKGFFQIDGVPPGAYLLEARHPRYAPAVTSVRVVAGEVTEVANPPLLLDLPKLLEVYIDPPADPTGQPWMVELQRMDRDSSVVDMVGSMAAGLDGSWKKPDVPMGDYRLKVSRPGGETWWAEELKIDRNPPPLYVRMDIVRVRGTVFFGKNPLSAKVAIGGRFGAPRIEAQSDDKGRFESFIPRPGNWKVYVSSDEPKVEREFPAVKITPSEESHVADVELRLPKTVLRGKVVDEQNTPIPQAIVSAMSDGEVQEGEVQVRTNSEGRFEIHGMLPGPTLLEADGGNERVADPVTVDVQEDEDAKSWVLVVHPQLRLSVTVVSSAGPVAGARIKAAPAGTPYIASRIYTSDAQGRAEIRLAGKTQQVLLSLSAPGFSYRMLRVPVPSDSTLPVGLDQVGGSLVVENQPIDPMDPNEPMVYVLHGGSLEPLVGLRQWADLSGTQNEGLDRSLIPNLEPGAYEACLALPSEWLGLSYGVLPQGRCASGTLSVNGELTLKVPSLVKKGGP